LGAGVATGVASLARSRSGRGAADLRLRQIDSQASSRSAADSPADRSS
jgi:hypothetical protein